jgi:hypothetical protein
MKLLLLAIVLPLGLLACGPPSQSATYTLGPLGTVAPTQATTLRATDAPARTSVPAALPSATSAGPIVRPAPSATVPLRVAAPSPGTAGAGAPPSPESVGYDPCQPGQVKGNRNSKIYHVPGGAFYEKTYVNVQCFNSAPEAQAAGYRASQR